MASVLVVEHDPMGREVISAALERAGHRVRSVASVEGAVAALTYAPKVDLVLLDPALPGIDDETALRAIRGHTEAPVLFVTTESDPAGEVRALRFGVDDAAAMPLSPGVLAARADAILRRTAARRRRSSRLGRGQPDPGMRARTSASCPPG